MKSTITQDSKGTRVAQMFYPTMSDKTTMFIISNILHNTAFAPDGSLSNKTVDALFNALVLPEYNRIINYKGSKNISGMTKDIIYFTSYHN
jgi:hypothetical protein